MNAKSLTGIDCYEARMFIGLSISAVANATGINRNNLSQFEKAKFTLTEHEKQKLLEFYEQRGYDFYNPEGLEAETVSKGYKEAQSQVKSQLESGDLEGMTEAVGQLVDSLDDLITANHYLEIVEEQLTNNFISYLAPIARTEETVSLHRDYHSLDVMLTKHFDNDNEGQNRGKTGFFGESAEERAGKLMALLALQQLRLMKVSKSSHVQLSVTKASKDSDMKRLLECIQDKLDSLAMQKELPKVKPELVA